VDGHPAELVTAGGGELPGELARVRASATASAVGTALLMQASIIGGSTESEVTELAVMPCRLSSATAVTTVTPLAR
jgi:hypothetical protein